MRLHHLSLTAFGPFAGTEEVHFDDLSAAGLFLLTGPTGAGKTSILDAVCFALYGSVPGARGVKALKSQHSPADARPEVVLDFSVRDRRFVVRRSPEWTRPKRRGTGLATEKASATLVETTDGTEHFLSSRAQEVGHFVGELIGMQSSQFVQVAMLPQGEFQAFLRASTQDRHGVLQHLFRTDRFSRIEEWVHDHSRRLADRAGDGQGQVQRILDTIADRAAAELPEDLVGDALPAAAVADLPLSWARDLLGRHAERLAAAREEQARTATTAQNARARHDQAVRVQALISRRDQACSALAGLQESREVEEQARAAVAADDRAGRCAPVLRLLDDAEQAEGRAEEERRRVLARLRGLGLPAEDRHRLGLADAATGVVADTDGPGSETLEEVLEDARERLSRIEALLPRAQALGAARRSAAEAERGRQDAEGRRAATTARLEALPEIQREVEDRLARASAESARREALALRCENATSRLAAARGVAEVEHRLVALRDAARETRDRVADAREHVQDLVARRLAGAAAELAGRLVDGDACLVCGSTEHPAPARPAADAVTERDQASAQASYEAAAAAHEAATARVVDAERELAGLAQEAGGLDAEAAAQLVDETAEALAAAEAAESTRVQTEREHADLAAEVDGLAEELHRLDTRLATLTQSVEHHTRAVDQLEAEILDVVGGAAAFPGAEHDDGDPVALDRLVDRERACIEELIRARAALRAHEVAVSRRDELVGQAHGTATEQGFGDVAEARGACLEAAERTRLEALLTDRAEQASRARAVLDDPEVAAVGGQQPGDLAELVDALSRADEDQRQAARVEHQQEQVVTALRSNLGRLADALTAWAPVREDHARAASMAKLVRGMGGDNHLQMRLSAYVLATRLDQVVDAANERLAHMRDQRYLLQRTGRAARKGSQAGLGLEVVDQWTGDVRDPMTLSGGETFVVSLALALGLADVVTAESGGTEIQTLFVDEGFGTLDADTLDDVMDRLDALRAGGRAVGVVSHVSELRNRIPTQVHVEKRRDGSSVSVRTLVG